MVAAILRIRIGQVPLDAVTLSEAVDQIVELAAAECGGTVYTPNVDHIVVAENNSVFRDAYAQVSLSLVDGVPVLWAARFLGFQLPGKVSGSDLFEPLVERAAARRLPIYLLGGLPGVAERARDRLCERFPGLQVVGVRSPKLDAAGNAEEEEGLLEELRAAQPALVFVACGAPKSELFSYRNRSVLRPAVLVCVGAAIDFASGTLRRAPRWMSCVGLEWLYRLLREPGRLAPRYLVRDPLFVWIIAKQAAEVAGRFVRQRMLPVFRRRSLMPAPDVSLPPRSETRAIVGSVASPEEGVVHSGVLGAPGPLPEVSAVEAASNERRSAAVDERNHG